MGAIGALEQLTINDVRDFYQNNFTQANVVIGLAGATRRSFRDQVQTDLAKLPKGTPKRNENGQPEQAPGIKIQIVQRETRSTAVSLGFPINVRGQTKTARRSQSWLRTSEQHRPATAIFIRGCARRVGLNYGDYAYIEYSARELFSLSDLGRPSEQIFSGSGLM